MAFRNHSLKEVRAKLGVERFIRVNNISCSTETWRNYEKGKYVPDIEFIENLCKKFDKGIKFFLTQS